MALTNTDKREIETMIRKEIKSFLDSNTTKQFEDKLIDKIDKDLEIKRGYAMTDEEVYIVKKSYELINNQCTLNT